MYSILSQGGDISAYVADLYVDKELDIIDLPKTDFASGSTCLVGETSNVYILGNDKEWKLL